MQIKYVNVNIKHSEPFFLPGALGGGWESLKASQVPYQSSGRPQELEELAQRGSSPGLHSAHARDQCPLGRKERMVLSWSYSDAVEPGSGGTLTINIQNLGGSGGLATIIGVCLGHSLGNRCS